MGTESIIIVATLVVGLVVAGIYFLNKWAVTKMGEQQNAIDKNKQQATIYVIDKKKEHAKNINLPKTILDNLPKVYRVLKMYFVQAKVGPQILTLMCDKQTYNAIPVKKNVKVELAGIYIVSVKGQKTAKELKQMQKEKKAKAKEAEKTKKQLGKESK